ncbi:MAG: phage minor head protein [Geminicoccaceae bacterium]|nr:phage minor head protein [Gammaproteobacteria bacterium]MDW8370836.1 phage minor head protein [Geminicoccaceae bacterium]
MRETLVEGFDEGASTWQLMDRIEDAFLGVSRSRARKIAETEVTIAQGVSTQTAMEQAGLEYKQWLSTGDGHVRDTHRAMHGQVKRVNEPFVSPSGATGMHPGGFGVPEEDIYCRCAAIPLFPGSSEPEPWPPIDRQGNARSRRIMVQRLWRRRQMGVSRVEDAALSALEREAKQCKMRVERILSRKASWRGSAPISARDLIEKIRTSSRNQEPNAWHTR